jgi:malate synthase
MTTRPKRRRKAARKPAKKRTGGKSAASKKAALKTRGAKPARRRKAGAALQPKAARPSAKTAETAIGPKPAGAARKEGARRRLALLGASGRRPKAAPKRGPVRGRVGVRLRVAKPARRAPRVPGVAIKGAMGPRHAEVLTPAALRFLADLHRGLAAGRERLRADQRDHSGALPDVPAAHTAIATPADRGMLVHALNSGAHACVADFTDAPNWAHSIEGQINLKDRWAGKLDFLDPHSRERHKLADASALLIVRPRGWHVAERHLTVDGDPVAGALSDFALYLFHNVQAQIAAGAGPCFCLPQPEEHAWLWQEMFGFAQERLGIPNGTIRASFRIDELMD